MLKQFLSLGDKKEFSEYKKRISAFPAPKTFKDIPLAAGEINIELSAHKLRLAKSISAYSQNTQLLYQQLSTSVEATCKAMTLLSDSFTRNAEVLRKLAAAHGSIEVSALCEE